MICKSINGTTLNFAPNFHWTLRLGRFALADCSCSLLVNGEPESLIWEKSAEEPDQIELAAKTASGNWRLSFRPHRDSGISIRFRGHLTGRKKHMRFAVVRIPEVAADHLLTQGVAMGGCNSLRLPKEQVAKFSSWYQTMITHHGETLQISFPLKADHPGYLEGMCGKTLFGLECVYEVNHYDGLEIELEPISFRSSPDGFELMRSWADANIELKKSFARVVAAGWNSWDYYRWTITEEEVLKNAEFIAGDPILSKQIKRIIIDDGWQYCYGEWMPNHFFPSGMAALAKELIKMGLEPGLWFAPSLVEPQSPIAQTGYDLLALGESGYPSLSFSCMKRNAFVLDPTQPRVRKHLYDLFSGYAAMGYRYFKLDFLQATLDARQFADRNIARGNLVRELLKPIHAATRGKALILGCNYPYFCGNKYVDAVRVGGDIHATWNGIKHNVASVAARFWSNGNHWVNDPDFALCRGFDTSDDPMLCTLNPCLPFITAEEEKTEEAMSNGEFKLVDIRRPQLEILLGIVLMAAGAINFSDNMPRLNASGLDLARRIASAESGETALPLDLFASERPAVWLQRGAGFRRVLLINWSDRKQRQTFDLKKHDVSGKSGVNFWTGARLNLSGSQLDVELEPASCLLAEIR
jgi:hypothetical protein